jgi:hypothetical protein
MTMPSPHTGDHYVRELVPEKFHGTNGSGKNFLEFLTFPM